MTMNALPAAGFTSSPLFGTPSGPRVINGSSGRSGTKTEQPLFTVWSTPWSKNWPKKVNSELNGGDKPTSVVMFGMNNVLCEGVHPAGTPGVVGAGGTPTGSVVHGTALGVLASCDRTGFPAAAMAAGLVEVWSSI